MASAPSDPKPVLGRVDGEGRLIAADPELERLQVEAGSQLGAPLALPQLAAVARVVQRLRIPVARRVVAAGRDQDVDMWVRAVPDGDEVALTIDGWTSRPPSPPRLPPTASAEQKELPGAQLSWSVDGELRLVAIAPQLAELLSIDPEAAFGEPLTRLFRLDEDEDGRMPLLAAIASRTGFSDQRVKVRQNGRVLLLSGQAAVGADGDFGGFEGSAALPDPLDAAAGPQPLVDSTIHAALRSPLDSIVQCAEEMIERADGAGRDDYAVYAADIAAAARHLLSVIRSLAEQAEIPAGHQVDLAELAFEAIALLESAANEREIVIGVQPLRSLMARGEPQSVIQILVNLIGNAVRYSAERTAVTVSFETVEDLVMVHVADEGPGIEPADQERIFEPFQRGQGGKGSGLGLSISRRLARRMGGDIQLESIPGEGSLFTLVLPAA